jgi:hypothetical protein
MAVELHYIANPQLPPAPGLRLAVHKDLAGRDQFLGVGAGLREVGQLQELPKPDGLFPDGHVDRSARRHLRILSWHRLGRCGPVRERIRLKFAPVLVSETFGRSSHRQINLIRVPQL